MKFLRIITSAFLALSILSVVNPDAQADCIGWIPEVDMSNTTRPPIQSLVGPDTITETGTGIFQIEGFPSNGWYEICGSFVRLEDLGGGKIQVTASRVAEEREIRLVGFSTTAGRFSATLEKLVVITDNLFDEADPPPHVEIEHVGFKRGNDGRIWIVSDASDLNSVGEDVTSELFAQVFARIAGDVRLFYSGEYQSNLLSYASVRFWEDSVEEMWLEVSDQNSLISIPLELPIDEFLESEILIQDVDARPLPGIRGSIASSSLSEEFVTDRDGTAEIVLPDDVYVVTPADEGWHFDPTQAVLDYDVNSVIFRGTAQSREQLINIKPGSEVAPINPRSRGTIPVAIISSPDFDAPTRVEFTSLTFGPTGNEDSLHYRGNDEPNCEPEDVNDDGLLDLMCHFEAVKAAFQEGDTEGILRGLTTDDEEFEGRDRITIVGQGHDDDADGADDEMEDDAPNNGDGNNDGLPDSAQAHVTSFLTAFDSYITLVSSPECTNRNVQAVSSEDLPRDPTYTAPEGYFRFELEGCATSDTTVFFHSGTDYSSAEYRRFGPTHADATPHWYTLPTFFSAVDINGQVVTTASFLLEDGGQGDDDLTANGVIVDPGGPAMLSAPFEIPTLSYGMLGFLAVFLGSAAVWFLRR